MISDSQKPILIEEYTCNYCSIFSIIKQLKNENSEMESSIYKLKSFINNLFSTNANDHLENLSKI